MSIPETVNIIALVFTYASVAVELLGIGTLLIAVIKDRYKALSAPAGDFMQAGGRLRLAVIFMLSFLLMVANRSVRIGGRSVLIAVSLICQRYAYLSAYLFGVSILVEIAIAVRQEKDQGVRHQCRNMELTTGLSMFIGYVLGYFLYIPY